MKLPALVKAQRQKENRALRSLLAFSLLGSLGVHTITLSSQLKTAWGEQPEEVETEVVIEPTEAPELAINKTPEPATETKPATPSAKEGNKGGDGQIELATRASLKPTRVEVAKPSLNPALQSDSKQPQPNKNALPDPKAVLNPTQSTEPTSNSSDLTSLGNQIERPSTQPGIFDRSGLGTDIGPGSGKTGAIGNSNTPGLGNPGQTGDPKAIGLGNPGQVPVTASPSKPQPEPPKPPEVAAREAPKKAPRSQPICVSCPAPKFKGREGSTRLTYDIDASGNVVNVRLRQSSGNPEVDREALETAQKWKFKPSETGYQNARQRITLQEKGSKFQRAQDQRRAQESERRKRAAERRRSEPETLPARPSEAEPPTKAPSLPQPKSPPSVAQPPNLPPVATPKKPEPTVNPGKQPPAATSSPGDSKTPKQRTRKQKPTNKRQPRFRPLRPAPTIKPIAPPAPASKPVLPTPTEGIEAD